MASGPFKIQVLNQISRSGLDRLPAGTYVTGKDVAEPDAVLVRSADMHKMAIPPSVQADRPRRRRHQQHPGEGHERARRAGVQCARRAMPMR